jgi:flagellin
VNTSAGSSTFSIVNQGASDTAALQLSRLNSALGAFGISASLSSATGSVGQLQFSSANAFTIGVGADSGGATGLATAGATGFNTNMNSSLLTTGTATGTYTLVEGSKTANITLAAAGGAAVDAANLTAINTALAAANITDVTAVRGQTSGTYSLQSASAITAADVTGSLTGSSATNTAATVTTGGGALNAINQINAAVQALGSVQGVVGAGENDLNYAIGLANSQITNFSSAESGIRDADVATEAANLTKAQVLEQASVAAMAQANSAPQAILSLLKG